MRNKTAVTALMVLALAPALAACGSSKSSTATSGGASATTSASATATSSATSTSTKGAKGKTVSASTGANGCTPVSKKGNCYQPKEFCAKTQHGLKGIAADGKKIVCKQTNGQWVWELA